MRTEEQLREALDAAPIAGRVDVASVIRASGRRRRVKQVAAGGVTTLAVVGIGVGSLAGIRGLVSQSGTSTVSSAHSPEKDAASGGASTPDIKRAPAEKINLCGGALAEVAPDERGLVLTVHFPDTADSTATSIPGTVTLTNTGTERVMGTTAATPAVTLSKDGMVLWHSNGPMIMLAVVVDLAPGQSMDYRTTFTPVRCGVEDDLDGFRSDLPSVGSGRFDLSAAIDLSRTDASGQFLSNDLITGPLAGITLR